VALSARTAQQCAEALSTPEWVVSLTTPKFEDLIYEHAALRPEPCRVDVDALERGAIVLTEQNMRSRLWLQSGELRLETE
jgi:hypothetical protein